MKWKTEFQKRIVIAQPQVKCGNKNLNNINKKRKINFPIPNETKRSKTKQRKMDKKKKQLKQNKQ